ELPIFHQAILRCNTALAETGIDLQQLLCEADTNTLNDPTLAFVTLIAIQIGLVDVLHSLNIHADGFIGHSVGEIACGYADGKLTAEQAIMTAYWRGYHINMISSTRGKMAAVRLDWDTVAAMCSEGVVPACHNAANSVTVSGDAKSVEALIARF